MPVDIESVTLTIKWTGFYKAVQAFNEMASEGYVRGMFKEYAEGLLRGGTAYAAQITHKETGNLSRAHVWEYDSHRMYGRIYINPRIVYLSSPRSTILRWPREYGIYEHARGGDHAFYQRTYDENIRPHAIPGMATMIAKIEMTWA